jgi:uncharacterized membrane protein (DUF2068 family)
VGRPRGFAVENAIATTLTDARLSPSSPAPFPAHRAGLRTIAGYEAAKGLLVLFVGMGLLNLIHRDVQEAAEELVRHFHLSPSARYPKIFLDLAARVTDGWLWAVAAGSLLYAGLRFAEGFGLWRGKRWAQWLGATSGAIYVPFEAVELLEGVTPLRLAALGVNVLIVIYLIQTLRHRPGQPRGSSGSP